MTASPSRADVIARLERAGCVAAPEEADLLLAAAGPGRPLEVLVRRREQGEPLPWITGRTRFCGRTLRVATGVYVPRVHTEELARRAADRLPPRGRALDLCAGSGAIAAHLAATHPAAAVVAVDDDERAVRCALSNGVAAFVGALGAAVASGSCDVVTAVPPYVPTGELRFLPRDVQAHEPVHALDGGADGLAVVQALVADAARLLRRGGSLLVEIGGDQGAPVAELLLRSGFEQPETWTDEDGDLRGIAAVRGGLLER